MVSGLEIMLALATGQRRLSLLADPSQWVRRKTV